MADTDFFDDDLVAKTEDKEQSRSAGSEDSMSNLSHKKEEVNTQVVSAVEEIERLRRRQQDLERERGDLEELARKQDEYEQGKRSMIERLGQGLVILDKQEIETAGMLELIGDTKKKFKGLLNELRKIDDEKWSDKNFREELDKALVLIDNARMEYNKAVAKNDVLGGRTRKISAASHARVDSGDRLGLADVGFGYWVKAGFALSLPIIIIAVLVLIYLVLRQTGVV